MGVLRSLILALAMLAGRVEAQGAPQAERVTIYTGARVLDVTRGDWRDVRIVVRGEHIAALLPAGAPAPDGAETVDMRGRYAIPGLIDAHVHVTVAPDEEAMRRELARNLFGGVTAVRDMSGDVRIIAHFARNARLGQLDAPDIHYAGLVAGPAFFDDERMAYQAQGAVAGALPWMRAVTPETDLVDLVAVMRGAGVSGMKIYANLSPDLFRRLTREAHRQGLPVWAHGAVFPTTPMEEVLAGANSLSHVCMLAYQTLVPPPASYAYPDRRPLDEARLLADAPVPEMAALWAEMARRGTILDTTAWVYPTIERMRVEMTAAAAPNPPPVLPPIYCSTRLAVHLMGQAARAGVVLAAGTDAPARAGDPWPGIYEEMMLMRDSAGIPPIDVIRAATINGARALGREAELGAIEPGRLANIAFLGSDPLARDANLRSVELTVRRGRLYWRRDYRP